MTDKQKSYILDYLINKGVIKIEWTSVGDHNDINLETKQSWVTLCEEEIKTLIK